LVPKGDIRAIFRLQSRLLLVEQDQFTVFSVQRRSDATTDRIEGAPQTMGRHVDDPLISQKGPALVISVACKSRT
jgi:hypothetical protein